MSTIDTLWVLLGVTLVFIMQAGFAMVETGATRAKCSGNIMMKNLLDYCFGTVVYWILGFGLMFGTSSIANGFIGAFDWFSQGDYATNIPSFANLMYQTVFCATSATIVSGAVAERIQFKAYCIYSCIISAVIYPISGHWIWGGGWLAQLGFHDFAGCTAVHLVGGVSALVGAALLGPRLGKYGKDGKPRAIPGHSVTLAALGVFLLWIGWFGFNPASTFGIEGKEILVSRIFLTTNMSAACSSIAALITTWIRYKKPDVSMTLNGTLAGLVAVTSVCDCCTIGGAMIIGIIAGVNIVFAIEFFDKVAKIDDPAGAISVHFVNGALGTVFVGLFAKYQVNDIFGENSGLFYGGGFRLLGVELLGLVSVTAWVFVTMGLCFWIMKKTGNLRVSAHDECVGLDIAEHGLVSGYPDFQRTYSPLDIEPLSDNAAASGEAAVSVEAAVPVQTVKIPADKDRLPASDVKMSKVSIVLRQGKFDDLKTALQGVGITGMTVTNVLGCGIQKGKPEYYRGVPLDITLLPKIQVDIVVCKVPVKTVIDTAKKVLYTGHIGDGKIFVYDVEHVVKVRTGEEDYAALQDVE